MRISDWSSDVCSSDLVQVGVTPKPADLQPSIPSFNRHYTLSSPVVGAENVGWSVNDLPPGFVLRSQRHGETGDHLIYSDGLASVSVYIEPGTGSDEKTSADRKSTRLNSSH